MISANIATHSPRHKVLRLMLKSIEGQFDIIRVYCNDGVPSWLRAIPNVEVWTGTDIADNGKFVGLTVAEKGEIYFTMDDDIQYPSDYRDATLKGLKEHGGIVTYHGRKLIGGNQTSYYRARHIVSHFNQTLTEPVLLDICGTGVSAFCVDDFDQSEMEKFRWKRMSDLVLSLEAAKRGVKITCLPHRAGWLRDLRGAEAIFRTESHDDARQAQLAAEIYSLNNRK